MLQSPFSLFSLLFQYFFCKVESVDARASVYKGNCNVTQHQLSQSQGLFLAGAGKKVFLPWDNWTALIIQEWRQQLPVWVFQTKHLILQDAGWEMEGCWQHVAVGAQKWGGEGAREGRLTLWRDGGCSLAS